jgi:hypothetical protein
MKLELRPEVMEKLEGVAKDCNLPVEKACEIILSEFVRVEGGRIYTGRWREGDGLMFVVQWPFLSGLVKLKGEDLAETLEAK